MASNSSTTRVPSRHDVLPSSTTSLGPRTAAKGLAGTTWCTTSQSNSMRSAARACLTELVSPSPRVRSST